MTLVHKKLLHNSDMSRLGFGYCKGLYPQNPFLELELLSALTVFTLKTLTSSI